MNFPKNWLSGVLLQWVWGDAWASSVMLKCLGWFIWEWQGWVPSSSILSCLPLVQLVLEHLEWWVLHLTRQAAQPTVTTAAAAASWWGQQWSYTEHSFTHAIESKGSALCIPVLQWKTKQYRKLKSLGFYPVSQRWWETGDGLKAPV